MTTDTPRTDAIEFRHCPPQPEDLLKKHEDSYALSRQLERELATTTEEYCKTAFALTDQTERAEKAEAEVAKLNHQLLKTESDLLQSQDINSFLDTEFRIACKRAERAEAEVERLKAEVEKLKSDRVHLITYCANLLEEVEGAKVESQSKINLTGGG